MKELFKYAIKVWVIAIALMWLFLLVRVYMFDPAGFKFDIDFAFPLYAFMGLALSFLISTPSFLLYVLAAKYICKMPYETITKKVLLSLALLLIMAIFVFFTNDMRFDVKGMVNDPFAQCILAASLLAVLLVQLPSENSPNEGAI